MVTFNLSKCHYRKCRFFYMRNAAIYVHTYMMLQVAASRKIGSNLRYGMWCLLIMYGTVRPVGPLGYLQGNSSRHVFYLQMYENQTKSLTQGYIHRFAIIQKSYQGHSLFWKFSKVIYIINLVGCLSSVQKLKENKENTLQTIHNILRASPLLHGKMKEKGSF